MGCALPPWDHGYALMYSLLASHHTGGVKFAAVLLRDKARVAVGQEYVVALPAAHMSSRVLSYNLMSEAVEDNM